MEGEGENVGQKRTSGAFGAVTGCPTEERPKSRKKKGDLKMGVKKKTKAIPGVVRWTPGLCPARCVKEGRMKRK